MIDEEASVAIRSWLIYALHVTKEGTDIKRLSIPSFEVPSSADIRGPGPVICGFQAGGS